MVNFASVLNSFATLAVLTTQADAVAYRRADGAIRERTVVTGRLLASASAEEGHLPKIPVYYADGKAYLNVPPVNATISYPLRCSVEEAASRLECIDHITGAPHPQTGVVAMWIGIPLGHCCGSFLQSVGLANKDHVSNETANSIGYSSFGLNGTQLGLRFTPQDSLFAQWWSTASAPTFAWLVGWRPGPANDTLPKGYGMKLYIE